MALLVAGCGQYLEQYTDEDKDLTLTIESDTTASPTYTFANRLFSFSVTLKLDRAGTYRILHATSCEATRTAGGDNTSGSLSRNGAQTATIRLDHDDILTYGKSVILCAADTAGYKTTSHILSFAGGFDTTLANLAAQYNESYGGGGYPLNTGLASAFFLFQSGATSTLANRGGTAAQNSASNPYSHGVYMDANDGHRLKYIVTDRANHRVLIFHSIPTGNTGLPDVVIGQSDFTSAAPNAGAAIGAQGFDQPVHASVSATGILFVTDYNNNRVLAYNTIPKIYPVNADFVLGQNSMAVITANNTLVATAARLNHPYATHAIGGKLYIVDQDNRRVVVHNSIPSTTAASASFVIGHADFTTLSAGTNYTVSPNFMNSPYDLLVYQDHLYISDAGNHRVLVFNTLPTASDARPDFVIGQPNAAGLNPNQGGTAGTQTLRTPTTIIAQGAKLAVADQENNRILFYDLPISADNTAATHGMGQGLSGTCGCTGAGAGTGQGAFNLPKGLIFDNGYIWIADGGNNRMQVRALPY
ncbi:MAG: NHL repeat-containing protein [Turneriella sp.]|nr:NHL repeat-containing protein [Turneriella sp.]